MIRATLRRLLVRSTFGADPAVVLRELRSLRASMLRIHREVLEEAGRPEIPQVVAERTGLLFEAFPKLQESVIALGAHVVRNAENLNRLRVMLGQLSLQVRITNEEDVPALKQQLAQQRSVIERLARASGDFTAAQLCGVEPEQQTCTHCGAVVGMACTSQLIEARTCCWPRLEAAWTAANKGTPRR